MRKKYRNPKTGEVFTLEGEDEETAPTGPKPASSSGRPANSDDEEAETTENKEPESAENAGENTETTSSGVFRTPFDFLDGIDGKDVEKIMLGAALGIGGVLAINGLCSFFRRA